jgi:hypothetical protein
MDTQRRTRSSRPESETPDLFGTPAAPDGFRYFPEALSHAEEERFVAEFERLPLRPFEFHGHLGNRRIYTFGHKYVFAGQAPRADGRIPPRFEPLLQIASRISGKPATAFEQVLVTEYAPGAGIGWHRDRPSYEDIVAVSFPAPCTLRLRRKAPPGWERRAVLIEPRSAYLLSGAVRNDWQHSITPMDILRYSVTLRTFRPGKGTGEEAPHATTHPKR